jgi:hypothetical protein
MVSNKVTENLSLMYQENAKVAAVFWEWRHKLLVACFIGVAALFTLAGWFYQQADLKRLLSAPLLLGAILSFASFFLDRRNAKILRDCYRVGKDLEHALINKGAIFEAIGRDNLGATYTLILGVVYIGVGILLLFTSVWTMRIAQ